MKLKPRLMFRDWFDVLVGLPCGLLGASAVIFIPTVLVGFSLGELINPLAGLVAGMITYFLTTVLWFLFVVWSITVDNNGIRFHRVIGNPKHLSWSEITSIEEVGRHELVLRGWLWPIFPSREMTCCLSAKGHFRISWKSGFCYFPPKDIQQFQNCIKDVKPTTQQSGTTNGNSARPSSP
jgi:hypothetical protein